MSLGKKALISALLGAAWYCILLIPPFTRNELLGGNGRSPFRFLVLMILASMILSISAWRFVARGSIGRGFQCALALPIVGAVVVSAMVFVTDMVSGLPIVLADSPANPDGPVSTVIGYFVALAYMFVVGVPLIALTMYSTSLYVALPMGLLHISALRFVERRASMSPQRGTEQEPGLDAT